MILHSRYLIIGYYYYYYYYYCYPINAVRELEFFGHTNKIKGQEG